jgi:hypothetical protein
MTIQNYPMQYNAQKGGRVEFGSDAQLSIGFRTETRVDPLQSKEAGRPVHVPVDLIRIQQPGERDYVEKPMDAAMMQRFGHLYEQYKAGNQAMPDGTSLTVLFPDKPALVEDMKYFKLFTVEQLAALNDTQIQNIGMGGREFREKAKQYLDVSGKGKEFHALTQQAEKNENRIKELIAKVDALSAALSAEQAKNQPKAA